MTLNSNKLNGSISLFQARLSNIRQIQWWRPTVLFITEYGFATYISLPASRLGLTGEKRDQVTLMHHGCWRTHMHTPHHTLAHPIARSLSFFLSHTPFWVDTLAWLWPHVIVPLEPSWSLLSVLGQITFLQKWTNQSHLQSLDTWLR